MSGINNYEHAWRILQLDDETAYIFIQYLQDNPDEFTSSFENHSQFLKIISLTSLGKAERLLQILFSYPQEFKRLFHSYVELQATLHGAQILDPKCIFSILEYALFHRFELNYPDTPNLIFEAQSNKPLHKLFHILYTQDIFTAFECILIWDEDTKNMLMSFLSHIIKKSMQEETFLALETIKKLLPFIQEKIDKISGNSNFKTSLASLHTYINTHLQIPSLKKTCLTYVVSQQSMFSHHPKILPAELTEAIKKEQYDSSFYFKN